MAVNHGSELIPQGRAGPRCAIAGNELSPGGCSPGGSDCEPNVLIEHQVKDLC